MTDIDEELIKRIEALKFKEYKIGLNSLIEEIDSVAPKIKTSPWTIIKSLSATAITLLILGVSILMLPIFIVIVSTIAIYLTYKIFFNTREVQNDD